MERFANPIYCLMLTVAILFGAFATSLLGYEERALSLLRCGLVGAFASIVLLFARWSHARGN